MNIDTPAAGGSPDSAPLSQGIHPLETNTAERARFERMYDKAARAAWRRAIEVATAGLPTWAQRRAPGPSAGFDVTAAVAFYRAGGVTLKQVADRFGVSAHVIGHHVRRAAA